MPAYAFRAAEPQESREELERQLTQEVRACKEVRSEARNYVKNFLISQGLIPRSLLRKKLFCKVKR